MDGTEDSAGADVPLKYDLLRALCCCFFSAEVGATGSELDRRRVFRDVN